MRNLANFVDWLIEQGAGLVSENHLPRVTVDSLSYEHAKALREHLLGAGFEPTVTDAVGDHFEDSNPELGEEPFSVTFSKPQVEGELVFVSTRAFGKWLMAPTVTSMVRVASCEVAFLTEAFLVGSSTTIASSKDERARKCPRKVVRDATGDQIVPADLRPYLLNEDAPSTHLDRAFEEWAERSVLCVSLALANEVHHGLRLEFSGPPRFEVNWIEAGAKIRAIEWFECVQNVARWVYDIDREVDLRHRLFSQEFARLAYGHSSLPIAMLKAGQSALEGARIAYSFHLQEISKDALKGLADLRKAVADDTQKLFEATRQLGLSAAAALFYAVGLVAARTATNISSLLYGCLIILGMCYVGMIILINNRAIDHQRELRGIWRSKLYRYLTEDEFRDLVQVPTARAEQLLTRTMWVVTILASAVFFMLAWSYS